MGGNYILGLTSGARATGDFAPALHSYDVAIFIKLTDGAMVSICYDKTCSPLDGKNQAIVKSDLIVPTESFHYTR